MDYLINTNLLVPYVQNLSHLLIIRLNKNLTSGSNKEMKNSNELIPLKIIASGTALPESKVYSSDLDLRFNKPNGFVQKTLGYRISLSF